MFVYLKVPITWLTPTLYLLLELFMGPNWEMYACQQCKGGRELIFCLDCNPARYLIPHYQIYCNYKLWAEKKTKFHKYLFTCHNSYSFALELRSKLQSQVLKNWHPIINCEPQITLYLNYFNQVFTETLIFLKKQLSLFPYKEAAWSEHYFWQNNTNKFS